MAYLDFAEPAAALAPIAPRHDLVPAKPSLTPLEWSVVALAQRDSLSSLRAPSRLATAFATIFGGNNGGTRLADPRLEALRRVSVHAWYHGFAIPESEIDRFYEAGFDVEQLELVVTSISRGRSQRRRRSF
ncbi:MAG: hypothetical protein JSS55_08815 [Proteobacteria bacterium]|nr:hypothetical protein [Pseudomonadota bacterium]